MTKKVGEEREELINNTKSNKNDIISIKIKDKITE